MNITDHDWFIWRHGWEDTCTAAGMSEREAKDWVERQIQYLLMLSRPEENNVKH